MARTRFTPIQSYNPVKFSVYRNAIYSTVANTSTKLPFDTKNFDTSNNFDVTTNVGRFTAPIAGFYQFNWTANVGGTIPSRFFVSLYKNGSEIARGSDVNSSPLGSCGSAFIQLAANDYAEVYYYDNVAGNTLSSPAASFNGFLVSAT